MATTKSSTGSSNRGGGSRARTSSSSSRSSSGNSGSTRRARDSEGRFTSNSWLDSARDRPYATAAIAAGVAGVGAFLWSRRGQIGELAESGYDRVSELTSERFGSDSRPQSDIAEEALTLKETGDEQTISQTKVGAVAY